METLRFKTNIKCSGCLAKVSPALNEKVGVDSWEVDVTNPQKTLTVIGEQSADEIISAVRSAGFEVERL